MLSSETKYKAACILEIVTGQRVAGGSCEVIQEDPLRRLMSQEQQRDLDKVRGMAIKQAAMKNAKKQQPGKKTVATTISSEDFRKLGNGFKIQTTLSGVNLFNFLEKCREFFLPDVISTSTGRPSHELPEYGHPNEMKHAHLMGHFERYTPSKQLRRPLGPAENPTEAITTYLLRSSDLLKFPDIELHFESMGSIVARDGADEATTLHLVLRPTLKVEHAASPLVSAVETTMPQFDNAKIMNYCLSQYFNMYMRRPRVSGPF